MSPWRCILTGMRFDKRILNFSPLASQPKITSAYEIARTLTNNPSHYRLKCIHSSDAIQHCNPNHHIVSFFHVQGISITDTPDSSRCDWCHDGCRHPAASQSTDELLSIDQKASRYSVYVRPCPAGNLYRMKQTRGSVFR